MVSLIRFQYLLSLLHLWKIWCFDLIGYDPYRQLNSSLRKNLNWHSPIKAWFMMACVALVHNKLEYPKWLIYRPPFEYIGLISVRLSFSSLKNCFPLRSNTWKIIYHCLIILLLSFFLLKSHEVWQGKNKIRLNFFMFLFTDT